MTADSCMGWTCRNGHFNERNATTTACTFGFADTGRFLCGAIRDPRDLYEGIPETGIGTPAMGKGLAWTDVAREKKARQSFNSRGRGGFVCYRCAEVFAGKANGVVRLEAMESGVEQPGHSLQFFSTKEDLKWHIRNVHRGKAFADKDVRKFRRDSERREQA